MWRTIDLVLRFAYVALIPALLPILSAFMPITGMLIGAGIATVVALIGSDLWRAKVERIKYVGGILAGMGRLGDFYREHPPKPLVYYIAYPALLPVILFLRTPRREFLLYRKLNLLAVGIIVGTGIWDYWKNWQPELSVSRFVGATIGMFLLQLIVTVMVIMPIVTTLVSLRAAGRSRALVVLVVLMTATTAYSAVFAYQKHTIPTMTWVRLDARTKHARKELGVCVQQHPDEVARCLEANRAIRAMRDSLIEAVRAAKAGGDLAAQLAAVRAKLAEYYKPDEAAAFRLASTKEAAVVYAPHRRKPAIWLAFVKGKFTIDPQKLPPAMHELLRLPGTPPAAPP